MKVFAEEKNFTKAEQFANLVLSNTKNSVAILESARVIKARSLMNSGKEKDAQASPVKAKKKHRCVGFGIPKYVPSQQQRRLS